MAQVAVFVVQGAEVHTDVHTLVGRRTEGLSFESCMWRTERQSVGKGGTKVHLPTCGVGEVVGEEEVQVPALVGGLRNLFPIQRHLCLHYAKAYPTVGALHELSINLHVDTSHIALCDVLSVIDNLHIINVIGVDATLCLVIDFGGKAERSFGHSEPIFHSGKHLEGALRLDVLVQADDGVSFSRYRVTQFLVERTLIVETCCQTEGEVVVLLRNESHGDARREEPFAVPSPVGEACAVVDAEYAHLRLLAPGVLDEHLHVVAGDVVHALQVVDEHKVATGVWDTVSAGVTTFPFARVLLDALVLPGNAGKQGVVSATQVVGEFQALRAAGEQVAGVFHIGSHSQLVVAVGLVEPVLTLDVVGLAFLGRECRESQREVRPIVEASREFRRTEYRAEEVLLLTVEVHAERLYVLHRSEARLAVLRHKVVVVLGDVSNHVECPVAGRRPREIGLIVEEAGTIFTLRFQ